MGLFSNLFGGVVSFFTLPTVTTGQNLAGMGMSGMGLDVDMGLEMEIPEMYLPELEIPEIPIYEGPDSIFDSSDSGFGDSFGDSFGSDSFGSSF